MALYAGSIQTALGKAKDKTEVLVADTGAVLAAHEGRGWEWAVRVSSCHGTAELSPGHGVFPSATSTGHGAGGEAALCPQEILYILLRRSSRNNRGPCASSLGRGMLLQTASPAAGHHAQTETRLSVNKEAYPEESNQHGQCPNLLRADTQRPLRCAEPAASPPPTAWRLLPLSRCAARFIQVPFWMSAQEV